MMSRTRVIGLVALVAVGAGVLVWLRARSGERSGAVIESAKASDENSYVGDARCAQCHPGEAFRHSRSGHSRTLAAAADSAAARFMDGKSFHDGERGIDFHYRLTDEGLVVTAPEEFGDRAFPLTWAFGSGEHAVTFLTLMGGSAGDAIGIEHRVSLFGPDNRLGLTPGHAGWKAKQPIEQLGRVKRGDQLVDCVDCHVTTAVIDGERLTSLRPNVGCERCHGPGGHHVRAVVEKRSDLSILFGSGKNSAMEQIMMCGQCHRQPDMFTPDLISEDRVTLARFQPIGLLRSACFRKSEDRLSCATCHDPHEHAPRERDKFESRCIECHAVDGSRSPPCPVSPRKDCIGCHMPPVEVHPGTSFHDHWIRVRKTE
jgi:hypothetical protein